MDDFFGKQRVGMAIDLTETLDVTFLEYLRELVDAGTLVSTGTTRDGGALSLTVTFDGQWRREYMTSRDDCHSFLAEACKAIRDAGGRPPAPTDASRSGRTRRGR